jgi:4-hydroxy-tetrahydrodipicolinate reductase
MSRLLLIGHGRMGRLVETLAPEQCFDVVGAVTSRTGATEWPSADVAIDFSVAEAVPANVERLARLRIPIVIGTTGWQPHEAAVRSAAAAAGIGVVSAPNFSVGVNVFLAVVDRVGALMAAQPSFGAWIHESHHAAKRDAPSGTALAIEQRLRSHGYTAEVPIASTRAGSIPGTHTLGFDAASETLTFTHQARDRAAFAHGSLLAARWVMGRTGWFTMSDVLDLSHSRGFGGEAEEEK